MHTTEDPKHSDMHRITTLEQAQALVHRFALENGWTDVPNLDKFDHLHEELLEMSQHLRYKDLDERIRVIRENHSIFEDGIGDLLFGICRLANQLNVDITQAFNKAQSEILRKYQGQISESRSVRDPCVR